jgi:glycosyltransferase involved in cell wall biosynthesis
VEAANYRTFGLGQTVVIVPNGVTAPDDVSPYRFLKRYPHLQGKRIVLFFGRVHKKKGVDLLVKAWNTVAARFPDAHLVIAGPDDGALQELLPRGSGILAPESITICGLLAGELKWSALASASAFVLPSLSEGLSMALLEALWYGVPVLITRDCNFQEIEDLQCTFLISPNTSSIAEGLVDVLSRPADDLRVRGRFGSNFIRSRYGWKLVGRQMADVYDWMRGGPIPSSVEML